MSIKVSTWVWDNAKASEGALLVLLAIADCAHEDGSGAWPSLAEIGRKARLSERGVRYALRKLEEAGELKVEHQAGPGGCNRYTVLMPSDPGTPLPGADIAGGNPLPPTPEASCRPGGQPTAPVTVLEPSMEPSELLTPPPAADDVVDAEFIDEKPDSAQTLIGEWVDSRRPDDPPPSQLKGQVARSLKRMLDDGVPYQKVRTGFANWAHSGYAVGALASFVDNAGKAPRSNNRQQETDDWYARSAARAAAGINVFAITPQKELQA